VDLSERRYAGFHEFVATRGPALVRTAYLLVGDHQLAEDLVQSALVRVLRHWRRIARDNPEAYIRRTIYHLHLTWRRRRPPPRRARWPAVRRAQGG
jgi:DNA-directed RNA polymerase specialized sigma24 family protein